MDYYLPIDGKVSKVATLFYVLLYSGVLSSGKCFNNFYMKLTLIGIIIGIWLVRPTAHINIDAVNSNNNTWHFTIDDDGQLITGGKFVTNLTFYNPAIFSVAYEPTKINFYYYPIGSHVSCIQLLSGTYAYQFLHVMFFGCCNKIYMIIYVLTSCCMYYNFDFYCFL